jgi:hypothetical protein
VQSIAEHQQTLRDDPDCEYADVVRDEIRYEQELLEKIGRVIKD